ncbi:MAG: hypothetical protein M3N49_02175 [Candidatus Eremiobacteraeota bacterium]|nr:hypothetical protein [Candidatus Eremiobacteraeota bacterium]
MYPRLRENVWHIDPQQDTAVLITSREQFQVPTVPALAFLKMRTYCTGHHAIDTIAEKSGLSEDDVNAILSSLEPAGIVYSGDGSTDRVAVSESRERLERAVVLWSAELRISYIGNQFAAGTLPKEAVIGWLLEMYHYIKDFPEAIAYGAQRAQGALRDVLSHYAVQERGHERYVLETLLRLGMAKAEVEASIPLLSTRLVGFLMRELFELEPSTVLLVAAMIEAQEYDDDQIEGFKAQLSRHYGISETAFDPYFEHQKVDLQMGHAELLAANLDLIELTDHNVLDDITNKMHDLKHAFDLQGIEIKAYYTSLDGKYVPRQPVTFDSI